MTILAWILSCLTLVAVLTSLAWKRAPLWMWTATAAVFLLTASSLFPFPNKTLAVLWSLFFIHLLFFQINFVRKNLLSKMVFVFFRANLPRISATEEEALLAGTSWWDAELFSGDPNWQVITNLPPPDVSAEEQSFLDGPVEKLCGMLNEWNISKNNDLPEEAWEFLKKAGFFGMIIPKRYGGLGFSALGHSEVILKLASRSVTAAVTAMVPNSLGPGQLLLRYGTREQKEHYLPRLAAGSEIPCFALTSPLAGSDASAMIDTGVVCRANLNGKENIVALRLNWEKRYITLAPVATIMGLAFKLQDPDRILSNEIERGITLALVPTNLPGVEAGKRHCPLDQAFLNGPTRGKDVLIPLEECVIGGSGGVGHGWRMLMECLADGRSISLPSLAAGVSKLVSRSAGGYCRIRKQFKMPIGSFEGVQEALTRIAGYTYAIDAVRLLTVQAVDRGERPSVVSAIAKYHCTELMRTIMNDGMDVFGGTAVCLGPRNLLGRFYESVPISITVEGANILTRTLIIFGQGIIRCHPYLLQEIKAAQEPDPVKALNDFDHSFWGHFGFVISNLFRSFILAVTDGKIADPGPFKGDLKTYAGRITRLSSALALVADMSLLVLGGDLKKRERLSARLGDVLSQQYIASAALKRFTDQGQAKEDRPLLDWVCRDSCFRAQEKLSSFLDNFPSRLLGKGLKLLLFPDGKRYLPPSDKLSSLVAESILAPGESRNRLTKDIYISADPDDPLGRIETAFMKRMAVRETEEKARKGLKELKIKPANDLELIEEGVEKGVLSIAEGAALQEAYEAMLQAIAVDEF